MIQHSGLNLNNNIKLLLTVHNRRELSWIRKYYPLMENLSVVTKSIYFFIFQNSINCLPLLIKLFRLLIDVLLFTEKIEIRILVTCNSIRLIFLHLGLNDSWNCLNYWLDIGVGDGCLDVPNIVVNYKYIEDVVLHFLSNPFIYLKTIKYFKLIYNIYFLSIWHERIILKINIKFRMNFFI